MSARPPFTDLAPAPSGRDAPELFAGMPARIGKYPVLSRLGDGATSEVFLAEDPFRQQLVAIKRLHPAATQVGEDLHYREHFFAAEAALVGRLRHPNIVQLLDAVDDPLQPYLVMEHVPGTTLRTFCRPDALLPLAQVVEIGFKCAMALKYVVSRGLVHRDVKPANILAVVDGGRVVDVKLTDFGSTYDQASDRTQVFRVGSLAYMSPEQLDGDSLDPRTDMYSLAAVLYHLVAGRPPHDATQQSALMHQIYHVEPPSLAALRDGVPPAMDELLRRVLAKRPQDRPADWEAFIASWSAIGAALGAELDAAAGADAEPTPRESARFAMLRELGFFAGFGDVELWEVVHRARWSRHRDGTALYRAGTEGDSFHIVAEGRVDVLRDGRVVAELGAGHSLGEMAYLAPNPALKVHSADVIVRGSATTLSMTPRTMMHLSEPTRHRFDSAFIGVLVRRLHAAHEALHHPRRIL